MGLKGLNYNIISYNMPNAMGVGDAIICDAMLPFYLMGNAMRYLLTFHVYHSKKKIYSCHALL